MTYRTIDEACHSNAWNTATIEVVTLAGNSTLHGESCGSHDKNLQFGIALSISPDSEFVCSTPCMCFVFAHSWLISQSVIVTVVFAIW